MSPRLSIIPAGAVTDPLVEPIALRVLCLLGRHIDKQGWCRRSQVKMAAELKCGRSSVQRSIEQLCELGWLHKKRIGESAERDGQPSNSYAYRVVLDRDDAVVEDSSHDDADHEADEGGCPPVGTPGAQLEGHPGAQPERAPGAHTYVGTKNVLSERPPLERERDARATDRKARFVVTFEQRWPTAAVDDRQRTAYAASELTEDEEKAAIDGIGPFLENLKRLKRTATPAGWKYLEERRWTLLPEKPAAITGVSAVHAHGSPEARALIVLHDIARKGEYLRLVNRSRTDGSITYAKPIEPRLLALAQAMQRDQWVKLDRQQAAAWESFLADNLTVQVRDRLTDGAFAPWLWPPKKDGTIYSEASQPDDDGNNSEGTER